jgi:hypothetical protein
MITFFMIIIVFHDNSMIFDSTETITKKGETIESLLQSFEDQNDRQIVKVVYDNSST